MKNGSNLIIVCLMLVYVCIAIPKRVVYAIKIIIIIIIIIISELFLLNHYILRRLNRSCFYY
jgi:hypothetical protein